ncbi:hypothetical protein [Peribacillus phoenicis]|uniref:hypothetical protein n=1 Tax=unclassified Peribacillus TaxID=2675266 RepID=UPI0039A05F81
MGNDYFKSAEIVEVIRITVTEGTGMSKEDPIKEVVQYWSKDGKFLFKTELFAC